MACCGSCVCVHEKEAAIITRFGKFLRVESPGCACVPTCCGMGVAGVLSLRVRQFDVRVETKTHDNVFVTLVVSVQYQVQENNLFTAFYRLSNPHDQITAFVCDVVRSTVPKMKLDDVFSSKESIAHAVANDLTKTMDSFGYSIKRALVIDIDPARNVKDAMNEINAAQRLRMASVEQAEGQKIMLVKNAEAQAESMYLEGVGMARQRKAIADGLKDSVVSFTGNISGTTPREVMDTVLITQYFDTLKELGDHSANSTIFLPHSPSSVAEVANQVRNALGSEAANSSGFVAPTAPSV